MQGSHHSAQKSMTTGVVHRPLEHLGLEGGLGDVDHGDAATGRRDRAGHAAGAATGAAAGRAAALTVARLAAGGAGRAGAGAGVVDGRSAPRSTAPRVKIDGEVRGSLMVP